MSSASALEMIASIIDLKKGDEVIIPSHTYCASIPFARNSAKLFSQIDLVQSSRYSRFKK